ncbi:nucleotidyltransferase domain-containing protein [Vibrio parahaemolyticus]|nr:nucleotidyltransferase [Vibrio parahaemolyticus]EGR0910604.1 nucleotidyltransferase [Vibrio parahaemolyticus]EGR5930851.1 nucleotidyltransferase [Vibrio parahaemolyticus]EGV3808153.1 nucleotidyltransferase [Vibrio parahaemolyticus]EHZ2575523.1 nucleotidyltransferase domain-containing protein [Vibrio parahaemolyticus]
MYTMYSQPRTGLQSKFEIFRENIELTQTQKEKIISSHTHLRERNLQPLFYVKESFLTGSYKRNTMIRPPSDVDAFVVINKSTYETTPNAILAQLKRDLNGCYLNSIIRRDKPCVTLDFNHCKIELTPAILAGYYPEQGYYIPKQGTNEWMLTDDPKRAETRLSQANSRLNGKLTPLIKMIKHAKQINNIKDVKSYQIEDLAIQNIRTMSSYRDGVQQMFRALGWTVNNISQFELEQLSDFDFAELCRSAIFGNEFPA